MSDERPTSLDDARIAKVFGLKPSSVMVVNVSESDVWKTAPLKAVYGLMRAIEQLGFGPDWKSKLEPGDPMFHVFLGCSLLVDALKSLSKGAQDARESTDIGSHEAAEQIASWIAQLEALMRQMHLSGTQVYRLAKAQYEAESNRSRE